MNASKRPNTIITAIVVTYNTSIEDLRINLRDLHFPIQVAICDNSTDEVKSRRIREFATTVHWIYLPMGANRGIAYAQNRGIDFAETNNSEFILLLDDDSRIEFNAVMKLLHGYRTLESTGNKIGAICAQPFNALTNPVQTSLATAREFLRCRDMMSSGALIPMQVVRKVGNMDESLFIDYVDFDWGWRASAMGYDLYLVGVFFAHALGEGEVRKLGIKLKVKNPVRHYYQTRNALVLLSRGYVPFSWKLMVMAATASKIVLFSCLVPPRFNRLRNAAYGLLDAFRGVRYGFEGRSSRS
jgi:rhamnosyltransferase